jgi:CBS domain-containing protein
MRVSELMSRQVQSCRPGDSLEQVARIMWEYDCGGVPVCAGNGITRVVGVITDRDICMCALLQGRPLRELSVSTALADRKLHACQPGDSLDRAERMMREARVRRLPVVDAAGSLVGMLSLADIAREASREQSLEHREVTELEVNETLAAICRPNSVMSAESTA